jgi:hypothetical protein
MAFMAGQTGVQADANIGSQIRTLSEGFGQISEQEGVISQAIAFQAIVYGCMNVFGIYPLTALAAQGSVVFSTGTSSPPPATQNVIIATGTIVQTPGGVQFQTTETVTLLSGTTSITATAAALVSGTASNVSAGSITTIVSGIPYPLYVSNTAPMAGGTNAESPSSTLGRFIAKVASIGLASPVAIANAAIGIQAPNSTETVYYATCYEPWAYQTPPNQVAGFTLYIDNGTGAASSALINQVTYVMNGNFALGESGYRDAGVPYAVLAVVPVNYSVVVTGVLIDSSQDAVMNQAVTSAVQQYQSTLQFGQDPQAPQITSLVGDVLANIASSFTVTMLNSSSVPEQIIAIGPTQRAILTSVTSTLA